MRMVELGSGTELVLGRVLAMHVRDDLVIDAAKHYIDTAKLNLIGRMHAGWYTRTNNLFRLDPISLDEWQARGAKATPSKDLA